MGDCTAPRTKAAATWLVGGGFLICAATVALGTSTAGNSDWELVRSVENPLGGTIDLVWIAEPRERDTDFLNQVSNTVCGDRRTCMINFWTDRSDVPRSGTMPVANLKVMSATYERHPSYEKPHLRLACWLYSHKADAVRDNCFVMPTAEVPWER